MVVHRFALMELKQICGMEFNELMFHSLHEILCDAVVADRQNRQRATRTRRGSNSHQSISGLQTMFDSKLSLIVLNMI